MRKAIRKVHLWLGLASGLVLSVLGITGSLYVFEPEINRAFTKEFHTKKERAIFTSDIAIATKIEAQTGKQIESIQWPQRGRDTYSFKLFDDDNWHFFDQTNGEIISGKESVANAAFRFVLDLHTTLTLGDTGRIITATSSLIFALVMLSTGIYLWWPRVKGRLKSSFKIKRKGSNKRLNYDLHNVTGFYFFLPLFLLGVTGACFYFHDESQWVLDKVSLSEPSSTAFWDDHISDTTARKPAITIQEALTEMNKYHPGFYKRNLWMTSDPTGTLSFAYQEYNQVHAGADSRIFLQADRYSGKIMAELNPDKLTAGAYVLSNWLLPLHFGEFGGLFTRILWFISGFIPALLTYTGAKIWLGKKNKKKKRKLVKV